MAALQNLTHDQLRAETSKVERETLEATRRGLRELDEAEQAGNDALAGLARQNEQIDGVLANLDRMRTDVAYSDNLLQKIASPFAFLFHKEEAKKFETVFGAAPDWSGPLGKKRDMLPGFKVRYFVLMKQTLMYFDASSQGKLDASELTAPRGQMALEGVTLEADRAKSEIVVKGFKDKWQLKGKDDNDFVGWLTMLERAVAGKAKKAEKGKAERGGGPARAAAGPVANAAAAKQAQQARAAAGDVGAQIDENLDAMLTRLDRLGEMACQTGQAIEVQNQKLSLVAETMDKTTNDMTVLQSKHAKRLKDDTVKSAKADS
jgi:hypothetical protein